MHLRRKSPKVSEQNTIEVSTAMIEAELRLLKVQVKRMPAESVELGQPSFGKAPEVLDPIDVRPSIRKDVGFMIYPQMLPVPHVDQFVVAPPTVGMNHRFQIHTTTNRLDKRSFSAIRDDLTGEKTRLLAPGGDSTPELQIESVDRSDRHAGKPGGFGGRQIHGKCTQQPAKEPCLAPRTTVIDVFPCSHWANRILPGALAS